MKKLLSALAVALFMGGAVSAQQVGLKEAIERSARGIEGELPNKAKIAVLNFNAPSKEFSEYVIEELTSELLEAGKVTVVDRQNLSAVMNEMKLQYSGFVSDESMVSIGKMIGAHSIISGTLTDMETYYRFRIRIINVETAVIQRQITSELKKDKQVAYLMGGAQAVREAERQEREAERARPTSNVRNNWLSAELSGGYNISQGAVLSAGARYERMFNAKVSAGASFFSVIPLEDPVRVGPDELPGFDRGKVFGIDAFLRCYPWGKKFFIGLALGYFDGGTAVPSHASSSWENGKKEIHYRTAHGTGFAITGELGFKIDVGKEGGFFIQPGFLGTFTVGKTKDPITVGEFYDPHHENDHSGGYFDGYWRGYLGAGWAF